MDQLQVLAFATRLAEVDLRRLRPGDWLSLREELAGALGKDAEAAQGLRAGVLVHRFLDAPSPEDYGEKDFGDLQRITKRIMQDVAAGRMRPVRGFDVGVRLSILRCGDRSLLLVSGSVRDTFVFVLLQALTQTSNSPIRRCPMCGRIFVRVRKQVYCTRRCANRASQRSYRKSGKGKKAVSEANHRAYERRVRVRVGPHVKIARVPRRCQRPGAT